MTTAPLLKELSQLLERVAQQLEDIRTTQDPTHALLRVTSSEDICVPNTDGDLWGLPSSLGKFFRLPVALRSAPDALRCAVRWQLQQPAFVAAQVRARKERTTKRGAYFQFSVATKLALFGELAYLCTDAGGDKVRLVPGPMAPVYPALIAALDPVVLIDFGQAHLFYQDIWRLLKQALGPSYWPGIWYLPGGSAWVAMSQLAQLQARLVSGTLTWQMVPIQRIEEADDAND